MILMVHVAGRGGGQRRRKKKGKREAKTRHAQQMEKNHQFSVKTFSRAEVFLGQEEDVKVLLIIDSEGCPLRPPRRPPKSG